MSYVMLIIMFANTRFFSYADRTEVFCSRQLEEGIVHVPY